MTPMNFLGRLGRFSACAGLCLHLTPTMAQDHCAAPAPCYSCVPRTYSTPAQPPQQPPAAPTYVTVQRTVMQQEAVMVPVTVMMQQMVYRPRTILESVPAAPVALPAPPQFVPPSPAPAAEPAAVPAPQFAPTRDCAGSPNTQLALMALMMTTRNQAAQAGARRAAAAPSADLQNRVTALEAKMDRLILALERTK